MKNVVFQEIGEYGVDSESERIRVAIKKDLKDALQKLSSFSHCVLFTKEEQGINCYVGRIAELSEKTGKILIDVHGGSLAGELVDIKPYFPCEEKADGYEQAPVLTEKDFRSLFFKGKPIGQFLNTQTGGIIKFQETEAVSAAEISKCIQKMKAGTFVRVLWWFDRFDEKRYRSHLLCNPPYDNAPRCGVFATRSPVRPNPLASTVIKVTAVDPHNRSISILGFDGFAGSMILQIMPHRESEFGDVKVPEWVAHWTDYKVFQEYSEEALLCKGHANTVFTESGEFFEELESHEICEKEDSDSNEIVVEGASIHNLKNINVRIPKEKITVITGVSGSGKSSLAFDTLFHESQKQFMDLLASSAFMGTDLKDSLVAKITGLQPSVAIEQKSPGMNPRSTVATATKIGEYLRLLFAAVGERVCPHCHEIVPADHVCKVCGAIFFPLTPAVFNYNHPEYMCPVCKGLGEELQPDVDLLVTNQELSLLDGASPWWGNLRKHREKPNANWMKGEVLALAAELNEDLEVPFKELSEEFKDQIFYGSKGRPVTLCYENQNGRSGVIRRPVEGAVNILQRLLAENSAGGTIEHIDRFLVKKKCSRCKGERLLEEGRLIRIGGTRYPDVMQMNISTLRKWCHSLYGSLDECERNKCREILKKVIARLKKLEQVGLGYITLDRSIPSLSGGEAQRLKIANQFGSGLSNILYIMDEPSKGLHPKDFQFLIEAIQDLKKLKNTVVVVEHKKELLQMADYLIEIGPGAGKYGGRIVRTGAVAQDGAHESGDCMYTVKSTVIEENRKITLKGVKTNNLKDIEVSIPLNKVTCVIGVSGSGKSSLVSKTLYPAAGKALGRLMEKDGEYACISGVEQISAVHYVSQKPVGKNARSTPGTYTGVFELIRDYYGNLPEAKKAKLSKEHFSFNSTKGQCEACKGAGEIAVSMHFMPDITVPCEKCGGRRYQESVLEIKHKGYSIADLLDLEIREVRELFQDETVIFRMLDMLCKVGLSYIKFGQSAATLSGGEAQRIRLAKELSDGKTEGALYILDEPASGLHDQDVDKLCYIINELIDKGATVVMTEHNPRMIREADYLIELGPEGGEKGGYLQQAGWC